MYKIILALFLGLFPAAASAQGLESLIGGLLSFINAVIIPLLLGIAFLFFLVNVIRYFVLGSTTEEGRDKAKALAIYSVSAFVLFTIFWLFINLLVNSIGLGGKSVPITDYEDSSLVESTTRTQQSTDVGSASGPNGEPENLLPPNMQGTQDCSDNTLECYSEPDNSLQGWIDRLFDIDERPFRDYFWADWGRGGSSGGNNNRDDGPVSQEFIDCRLPNGEVQRITLETCTERGGQPVVEGVQNSTGNNSASFQLVDCTFIDQTTGQSRTIQTSVEACAEFNSPTPESSFSESFTSGESNDEPDPRGSSFYDRF